MCAGCLELGPVPTLPISLGGSVTKAPAEVFKGCHMEAVCMKDQCCIVVVATTPTPSVLRLRNHHLSQLYLLGPWIYVAPNLVTEGGSHEVWKEVWQIGKESNNLSSTIVFQQPVAWRHPESDFVSLVFHRFQWLLIPQICLVCCDICSLLQQ